MMFQILEKLRRPGTTAAELKVKLSEVEEALPAAETALADAEAARSAGLLTLPDTALERVEAEMARARRDRDRLRAAEEELVRRVAEADAAEAKAALDQERAVVEKRAAAIAGRLRSEYEKHASAIVALLSDLDEAEEAVRAVNVLLHEAGRADTVAAVEARVVGAGRNFEGTVGLMALTSLRPIGACRGWGAGRLAAENFGLPS
jgi:chromosome segregation ATPase